MAARKPPQLPQREYERIKRSDVEAEAQKMPFASNLGYLMREKVRTISEIEKEVLRFEYNFFNEGTDKECGDVLCDEVTRGFERDIIDGSEDQLRRLQNIRAHLQRINGSIFGDLK